MRKDYQAVRIEIPKELNERFKKAAKRGYRTPTGLVREFIVGYVKEKEKEEKLE